MELAVLDYNKLGDMSIMNMINMGRRSHAVYDTRVPVSKAALINFYKKKLSKLRYGFFDYSTRNFIDGDDIDKVYDFDNKLRTMSPRDMEKLRGGSCFDTTAYMAYAINRFMIHPKYKTYYWTPVDNMMGSHTFMIVNFNNKFYYIEAGWYKHKGILQFDSEEDAIAVAHKNLMNWIDPGTKIRIVEYDATDPELFYCDYYYFRDYIFYMVDIGVYREINLNLNSQDSGKRLL